jgi:hypothetical protein
MGGGRGRPGPPWLYQRPPRYPVYRRYDPYPGWYPPGHVQLYGGSGGRPQPPPSPYYYEDLFRSSSAHLPAPPPTDYAWAVGMSGSRPARRSQSSVQQRSRRTPVGVPLGKGKNHKLPGRLKPSHNLSTHHPQTFQTAAAGGFAGRFFNDRGRESGGGGSDDNSFRLSNQMLAEHSNSYHQSRGSSTALAKANSSRTDMLTESRHHHSSSNESIYIQASLHQHPLGGRRSREEGGEGERKASLRSEAEEEEEEEEGVKGGKRSTTYRIVSELLPRNTRLIHEAIVESAGRPEVILEAGSLGGGGGQLRKHSRESSSCTCYQCQEAGFRKHSAAGSASLVHDENYNLTVPTTGK